MRVDPVEPEKVLGVAQQHGVLLKLVLTTHHHWDHAGGNEKLKQLVPGIKVYGGSKDNVKGCTDSIENGDKLSLGADVTILSLHTPCHTKGHISYYVISKEGEDPAVFTGDTLFIAGCGKFSEGIAEQKHQSLCVTLASLPNQAEFTVAMSTRCRTCSLLLLLNQIMPGYSKSYHGRSSSDKQASPQSLRPSRRRWGQM